jgi:hypothetical protein
LIAACQAAPTPASEAVLQAPKAAESNQNQYLMWRTAAASSPLIEHVAVCWAGVPSALALVGDQARRLAAVSTSLAAVERVLSEGRGVLDHYQGGCNDETIGRRLFCKVNKRLLERVVQLPLVE